MNDDEETQDGILWSRALGGWLLGEQDPLELEDPRDLPALEDPAPAEQPDPDEGLDADAAIVVANLRATLRAREAEIAALRGAVQRPGYDAAKGAPVGARPPGRPRVVTPDVQAVLLRALRSGVTRNVACGRVGISKSSLTNALRADPLFKADVHRAELQAIAAAEKNFARAAGRGDDWRASESYLKRRRPDDWALPAERVVAPNVAENRAVKEDVLAGLVAALVGPVTPGEQTSAAPPPADGDPEA